MKSSQRTTFSLAAVWFLCTAVRFLFYHEINNKLWILTWFVDGILGLAGVALVIIFLFQKTRKTTVAAVLILGLICVDWFTPASWLTGTYFRMWRMESTYEKEVARILEADDKALETLKSPAQVDKGPPRRVAFSWGGIIDNWSGIVYDPSGEVLLARQRRNESSNRVEKPKLDQIRFLFGGEMIHAHHLWGPWYYCVFT